MLIWDVVGVERWEGITVKQKETLGEDEYVLYIDCVDSFIGVYMYVKIHQIVNLNPCRLLCVNYTLIMLLK